MNNILSQLEEAVTGKAEHMSPLAIACSRLLVYDVFKRAVCCDLLNFNALNSF